MPLITPSPRPTILAIESSCDETAASVIQGEEILSDVIASQIRIHAAYGGVVPEIASRKHLEVIESVTAQALSEAGCSKTDLDCVAVTHGPGLVGALLVGVSFAKALAFGLDIPLIGVNHMHGHIGACFLSGAKAPFLALAVSGGHTEIIKVLDETHYTLLGTTKDDACGEAFDKVARVLGLSYPGGAKVESLAQTGNAQNVVLPTPMLNDGSLDFSFSGLKSAVIQCLCQRQKGRLSCSDADIAESFCMSVATVLTEKTIRAAKQQGLTTIALCGGVAANDHLRGMLQKRSREEHLSLILPPKRLCTDNASMIARAALSLYRLGHADDLFLNVKPSLEVGAF